MVEFKVVEIDPLLAWQVHIYKDRSKHHCDPLSKPPTEDELYKLAYPENHDTDGILSDRRAQSMIVKTKNLNLGAVQGGLINGVIGLQVDFTLSLVHVVRYNGRCYLHNGYHRAFGARMAGATHIPCLFRDVATPDAVGIRTDGTTQEQAALESTNPPTMAHFSNGRALDVKLRAMSRIIHVSWAEYILPDD